MNGPWSLEDVIMDMSNTEQCPGLSILQHGVQVHERYRDLLRFMKGRKTQFDWSILPDWFKDISIPKAVKFQDIRRYQLFHDCGKPYCKTVDSLGRSRFPNHEEVSYGVAKRLKFNNVVCELIRLDMICHRVEDLSKYQNHFMINTLLLTALAEVFANCEMFGGQESTSFKIKYKRILNRIKKIMT